MDYIESSKTVVAYALSRVEAVFSTINYEDLARSQTDNESLGSFLNNSQSSLQLEKVTLPGSLTSIYCDTSTGKPCPFLTTRFRRNVFIFAANRKVFTHPRWFNRSITYHRLLQILFDNHWPFHSLARGQPLKGHIERIGLHWID